ncbi:MAG: tetratricopeptide repeat protein [Nitrospinae bacterium]|nr:tetratricopeptide repeat protein [Nitrospinota bacterium]
MTNAKWDSSRWAWIGIAVMLVCAALHASADAGTARWSVAQATDLEDQARRLFDEGRYADAIPISQAILKNDPRNRTANILLSFALARQGLMEPAIAQTRRALDLFPTNVKLQLLLAGLLGLQDATRPEGIQRFDAILRTDPQHPSALLGLAENERYRGNFFPSIQYFTQLADRFPDDARYQVRIGQNYAALGQLALSLAFFTKAYGLAPTNVDAVRSLAILNDVMDRPQEAVRYYRELVALFPHDVWAQLALRSGEESLAEPRLPMPVEEMQRISLQTYLDGMATHSDLLKMREAQIDRTRWRSTVRFLPNFFVSPSTSSTRGAGDTMFDTNTSTFNFSLSWSIPDLLFDPYSIQLKGMKADLENVRSNLALDVTATYYQRLIEIDSYRQAQHALALDPQNMQLRQNKRVLKFRITNMSERLRVLTGMP